MEKLVMLPAIRILLTMMVIMIGATDAMAIEEAAYQVVKKEDRFEVRDYAPYILAETIVEGEMKEAGNIAFRRLFKYISGDNRSQDKVAMTAPVSQVLEGEKIEMTAPVGQQNVQGRWAVSFMMPASYTLETLPVPVDQKVSLRQVPARRLAAVRYSGTWSKKNYLRYMQELESWIKEPIWARYNPPFTLWFLRRNEILIPVDVNTD
jgi:hypothetical protein